MPKAMSIDSLRARSGECAFPQKARGGICNQRLKHYKGDESDKASCDVRIVTTTFASSSM